MLFNFWKNGWLPTSDGFVCFFQGNWIQPCILFPKKKWAFFVPCYQQKYSPLKLKYCTWFTWISNVVTLTGKGTNPKCSILYFWGGIWVFQNFRAKNHCCLTHLVQSCLRTLISQAYASNVASNDQLCCDKLCGKDFDTWHRSVPKMLHVWWYC